MPPQFVLLLDMLAGWMNRHQQMAIEYLVEENRILKELHGDRRLNFTNEQLKRLARKGKAGAEWSQESNNRGHSGNDPQAVGNQPEIAKGGPLGDMLNFYYKKAS